MPESSLAKKLGIKPGQKLLILHAPEGYLRQLGELPEGAVVQTMDEGGEGSYDFVQVFVRNRADVDNFGARAVAALKRGGLLWFSYPKQSSKVETDITRDSGWGSLGTAGLRPVTQIAVDDTWSALRFRPTADVKPRGRA